MSRTPGWSAAADEDADADGAPAARVRRTPLRVVVVRALARYTRPFPFVRLEPPRSARR